MSFATYLKQGITLALAGEQEKARQTFEQLLQLYPDTPEAYYNLGLLAKKENLVAQAEAHLRQALTLRSDYGEALYTLGLLLKDSQRLPEAAAALSRAAELIPSSPYAYFQLGLVLHALNRPDGAKTCFSMAIDLKSDFAEAYNNLALVMAASDEPNRAHFYLDQAIKLRPDYTEAYNNRGILLSQANLPEDAVTAFQQALQLEPDNHVTYNNLGLTYQKLLRCQDAQNCFKKAIELQPHYAEAHNNLGLILDELNRPAEAIHYLARAVTLKPDFVLAATNLASVLGKGNRLSEAETCLRQALTYRPDSVGILRRLALVLRKMEHYEEAEAYYQRAIQNGPPSKTAEAVFGLGTLYLLQGRYHPGWDYYEKRLSAFKYPQPPLPYWEGEDLGNRRLLLFFEQGFGDTLHFIRYVTLFADMAAAVGVVVQGPLQRLIQQSFACPVYKDGQVPLEQYDMACSLHSLPYRFDTRDETIPDTTPYLRALPTHITKWRKNLARLEKSKPRIGIVWAGNPRHDNDHNRSIPFSVFQALIAQNSNAHWISLQVGKRAADAANSDRDIFDAGTELGDFADTAGLIANLDLVITVDSAVAHLSGALGKPTWILLPAEPDWRWQLKREDSPWYPAARLFRQTHTGDWHSILAKAGSALQEKFRPNQTPAKENKGP